ncbi:MAG: hypothetical protein GY913_34250 [Proteobacteria bacterium]|nr:hypothetical protein [Pseudomonadota bacterium]MCP4921991.1 hypothetical protein [Pseudomonadota bacterium]
MILALLGTALADCGADPITDLRAMATPDTYECAIGLGPAPLLVAAAEPLPFPERITRALAVWRLRNLETAVPADEARAYGPADVRLLTDGIKAHRGRETAAEEHAVVFEQMEWYAPRADYTDGRLTELDQANLAMLLDPPAPVVEVVETAADAMATAPAKKRTGCGCGADDAAPAGALILLLGLFSRRRGRTPSAGTGTDAAPPQV